MAGRTEQALWALYWWGPVAAVVGVLFYFSSQSRWSGYLGQLADQVGTKPFHVLAYSTLALTLLRAMHQGRWSLKLWLTLKALLLLAIFSVLDEAHQLVIPDRPHSHTFVNDVLLDTGAFFAVGIFWQGLSFWWRRRDTPRRTHRQHESVQS